MTVRTMQVEEMQCDLSRSMAAIQQALIHVLDSLLKQVQRNNNLDSSELSLAHAFSRSFDAAIKQQLNPVWNTLSRSTRTIVSDMRSVQVCIGSC
jgi:DNA excision repair protein ERCC-4